MKYMKIIFALGLISTMNCASYGQQKIYDIATYTPPKDWTEKEGDGKIAYSSIDGGSWAQIAIYQHRTSEGDINTDFDKDWNELVAANKTISSPEKTTPQKAEGWTVMSGSGIWQYNGANVASMLTVYSNNKVCIAILCNTTAQPFLKEYKNMIASLDLDAKNISESFGDANSTSPETVNPSANTGKTSLVGLWTDYILETTGYSINGMPQYTAGYLRKEYNFYPDGTYLFRNKQWLTKTANILFIYETGTYSVTGNQLTITPKNGKGGFWGKTSSTKEWGKFIKSSDYTLEKTNYIFEITHDPTYGDKIILKPGKPTTRDGGKFNAPGDPYEFYYSKRELESSIDNPTGFQTGFEKKPLSPATKNEDAVTIHSPLTGKIWEGTTTEKFSNAGGTNYNTGGFATNQYKFNADGTYRFVSVTASHFTDTKSLQYETGTYTINGNQLTVTPTKGYNEEWSKIGKTSNGNSDVTNRAINETWGKKLKTSSRKLETVTYTFSIGKNGDRNALILQYSNGHTEREGNGNRTYLNETSAEKSIKLPATIK